MKLNKNILTELDNYANNLTNPECDGLTKVLSYYLQHTAKIKHVVNSGQLIGPKGSTWHQWIELSDGTYIDYRAKMWQGNKAPNGIFKNKNLKVEYVIKNQHKPNTSSFVFDILTML